MIGRIQGILLDKQAPWLLIDVQGVGYEVQAPMTTLYQLPEPGNPVILHTHLVVREDAHQLFGFATERERTLFRILVRVNGVGPKLGLTILSGIETDEFVRCVRDDDVARLVKLPGVGKKTAERLLIELRDRLKEWIPGEVSTSANVVGGTGDSSVQEAESALVALGYKPQEASRAVARVTTEGARAEELIRMALKGMVK